MKAFKIKTISKNDTLLLKAIGIFLIAFHNYYRWVKPISGENEFGMSAGYIQNSFSIIQNNPLEFINVFFNFFGHYGVQIFIFLSAYGLTKVYLNKQESWMQIVVKRFVKLYPSLLLAAFTLVLFGVSAHGNLPSKKMLFSIIAQLSLFSTLIPGKALSAVGPWWFYSMIFQFYLLFPVLLSLFKRLKINALFVISVLSYALLIFVNPLLRTFDLNILHTVFGHLPEFCLGIWIASKKEFKINWLIYVLAIAIFVLSNFFLQAWYFSHLSIIVILLPILQWITVKIKSKDFINKILTFIGLVSVYIFAIHGFLRWEFVGLANFLNHPIAEFLVGLLFILFVVGIAWMLFLVESQIRKWIFNEEAQRYRYLRLIFLLGLVTSLLFLVKMFEHFKYENEQSVGAETSLIWSKKYDFENRNNKEYLVVDSVSYSGLKSCVITSEQEYGPVIKIDLEEFDIKKLKAIKVSCALYKSGNSEDKVHIVLEHRKTKRKARLGWYNRTFDGAQYENHWCAKEFVFEIDNAIIPKNSFYKIYLWNNSNSLVIIDDFTVDVISNN